MQTASREQIQLSDMTLTLARPALQPSKDFPPPRLLHEVDLSQIVKPKLLFHGHWDGPRYQLLSVTGTMHIWLDIRRWPAESRAAAGCEAKARAYIDQKIALDRTAYEQNKDWGEARVEVVQLPVAGRRALRYVNSFDTSLVSYVIPVNGQFVLNLIFQSALNSDPAAGWPGLFNREKDNFLEALQLSGDAGDCR